MNNAVKAALLSGLVFPGLGQVVLKHYKRGVALMIAVSVSMAALVIKTVQYAFTILQRIELEGGVIDIETITAAATQATSTPASFMFNFWFLLIVVCWIFGIVDAYRIGKEMDL